GLTGAARAGRLAPENLEGAPVSALIPSWKSSLFVLSHTPGRPGTAPRPRHGPHAGRVHPTTGGNANHVHPRTPTATAFVYRAPERRSRTCAARRALHRRPDGRGWATGRGPPTAT